MISHYNTEYLEAHYRLSNTFNGITFLNNECIVLHDSFYNEPTDELCDLLFEYFKPYKFIIFAYSEHWFSVKIKDLVVKLINEGKYVLFSNFTFGYEQYLKKFINSDRLLYVPIKNTIVNAYSNCFINNEQIKQKNKKEKLLLYFTYNRAPHKDYVIQLLREFNLLNSDSNLITYHNFDANSKIPMTLEKLSKSNPFYKHSQQIKFIEQNNIDIKFFETYQKILDSENFNIQDQAKQRENLIKAHSVSMFNIISEACSPIISDDEFDVFNYFSSITGKTIFPILFENVFHIIPKNYLYENALKELGFQMYFESDDDFFTNLNESYYYSDSVQSKIKHNKQLLLSLLYDKENYTSKWMTDVFDSKSMNYTYKKNIMYN